MTRFRFTMRKHRGLAIVVTVLGLLGIAPQPTPAGIAADARIVDIMVIDSRERDGTLSAKPLEGGKNYLISIVGTYSYGASGLRADAECSEGVSDPTFRRGRYIVNGEDMLDVVIGSIRIEWEAETPDAQGCDPLHAYHYSIKPNTTGFARLKVRDGARSYGDNQGMLTAVIYQTDCESVIGCVPPVPPAPTPPTLPTLPTLPPLPPTPGPGDVPIPTLPTLPELPPLPSPPGGGNPPPPPGVPEPPAVPIFPGVPPMPQPPGGGDPGGPQLPGTPPLPEAPALPEAPGAPQAPTPPPAPGAPGVPQAPPLPSPGPGSGTNANFALASSQLVESLSLDSTSGAGVTTRQPLRAGRQYTFVVSGLYKYDAAGNVADAECSTGTNDPAWRHDRFGPARLDVAVNGTLLDWKPTNPTEAFCSDDHAYTFTVKAGSNTPVNFRIIDNDYSDNSGVVHVEVLNSAPSAIPNLGVQVPGDLVDIVTVDSRDLFGAFTSVPLAPGANYLFVVQGSYFYGAGMADAECASVTQPQNGGTPDPAFRDDRFPGSLLDMTIANQAVTWQPVTTGNGPCDPYHTYRFEMNAGPGGHALFRILENSAAGYADNVGALQITVYRAN